MDKAEEKEKLNQKFTGFLASRVPYASNLTMEELAKLRTAYERNEEAIENWDKSMKAAIGTIGNSASNKEALMNDADFYINALDQSKAMLAGLLSELDTKYGYTLPEEKTANIVLKKGRLV